jgi:Uma2 family endonuclease
MSTAIALTSAPSLIAPVVGLPQASGLAALRHRRYTVEEYEDLVRQGRITENDRCELIHGVIADKMGIGDLHSACVKQLNRLFGSVAADRYLVSIQDPIRFADSEPEPDCALVKYREDCYRRGKPRTADVLLIVEVADSSLDYDRDVKRPMYATAGIADFWIVNLIDDCVEVYRQPQPGGAHAEQRVAKRGESVTLLALPELVLQIDDILGRELQSP